MTPEHIAQDLLRYHLGAAEDAEHASVEAHLLDCRECLTAYLGLKRRFDFATATDERPSARVRERLRADLLRRQRPARNVRFVAWGMAAAAAALLMFLWVQRTSTREEADRVAAPERLIDTGSAERIAQAL
jgi:hypothetical protein